MYLGGEELQQDCAAAGLRYVTDEEPGITRRRFGKGFAYFHPSGKKVKDKATLERIASLVIPPAYEDVWICLDPKGHLQVTGMDARGRKQYRYHPLWTQCRQESKFSWMGKFVEALPRLRRRVRRDLRGDGFPRERVLAACVRLLETTMVRVGNQRYARENDSFGLTTLRRKHLVREEGAYHLHFNGKSGKEFDVPIHDQNLEHIITGCCKLSGQSLLTYCDDNNRFHGVKSSDVNEYLRDASGDAITAKDFRTWGGSLLALRLLLKTSGETKREIKRETVRVVKQVAETLNNTPATCRKYYIHPRILELFEEQRLNEVAEGSRKPPKGLARHLRKEEIALWRVMNESDRTE